MYVIVGVSVVCAVIGTLLFDCFRVVNGRRVCFRESEIKNIEVEYEEVNAPE